MTEKPILFNTEMVRAILDGRKTQTRRIIKDSYFNPLISGDLKWHAPVNSGDILWVRETWKQYTTGTAGPGLIDGYLYKADEPQDTSGMMVEGRWHPSIHMPKDAARIWLKVTDIRCEQLNDMTEEDAIAEGFPDSPAGTDSPLERFSVLWDKTVKRVDRDRFGWYGNPWVLVISFKRIERDRLLRYADNDGMQGGLMPAT